MSVRIAVVGSGPIAHQFVEAASQVEGIEVAAVFSRTVDKAASLAGQWGGRAFTDLSVLLADPEVDAVYLATPNGVHAAQARAALLAGKHVLVEKPAVPTAAEFADLVELAQQRGLVILEAMRTAYDPGLAAVRRLISELGPLRKASLSYCQRSSRYDQVLAGQQVNIFDPELAGGSLYDIGIYCVHAMISLFGVPEGVAGGLVRIGSGADGAGAALAFYPGLVVDIGFSKITASPRPSEIQGERATLLVDHLPAPRRLELVHLDGRSDTIVVDATENPLVAEVEYFVRALAGDVAVAVEQRNTLATVAVVDQLRADAAWV